MQKYRDVVVRPDFRMTSQNPGEGHSVTEPNFAEDHFSAVEPHLINGAIEGRIARTLSVSLEQAKQLFQDVQKFLWMSAQASHACVPAPLIDDAWHEFLLFTREYEVFCREYCGGFMHHQPHDGIPAEIDPEMLQSTIDLMHTVFGGKPNTNWDYIPSKEAVAA